jgi:hypothetical protein
LHIIKSRSRPPKNSNNNKKVITTIHKWKTIDVGRAAEEKKKQTGKLEVGLGGQSKKNQQKSEEETGMGPQSACDRERKHQ